MGYRFSLENANIVSHLIEGNVLTFMENALYSDETYTPTIEYLKSLSVTPKDKYYTSMSYFLQVERSLRKKWDDFADYEYRLRQLVGQFSVDSDLLKVNEVKAFENLIRAIHNLIGRSRIKALIVPGFDESEINRSLISEQTLKKIISIHPKDSCLVLQTEEIPNRSNMFFYNVFKHFDKAAINIDQWPGILLWDDKDSVFCPVNDIDDVLYIFDVIHFERETINYLTLQNHKRKKNNYAYLLHLSDLHFGNSNANKNKTRLLGILENEILKIADGSDIYPLITGDLMDSPSIANKTIYDEFGQLLQSKGTEKPISVLGNHDVDKGGFVKVASEEKALIEAFTNTSRLEIQEDLKAVFVKFYSNTGGKFAQGMIGTDQLAMVGNEIDKIPNKEQYTYFALLHHHPKPIEEPSWKAKEWYERILGNNHEKTMELIDSDIFLEWLERRNFKFVLHGHKHIPKIQSHNNINIISAGSSTGTVKHKEKNKTYLTYNLIKYDTDRKKPVSCIIYFEDIIGAGLRHLQTVYF